MTVVKCGCPHPPGHSCAFKSLHKGRWLVCGFSPPCCFAIISPAPQRGGLEASGSAETPVFMAQAQVPRSLTRAGVGARAPLAAVPNRFKHSPEEFFGGQDPDHLGSCLLKNCRKLCEVEKMNEEEQIIKCSKHKLKAG